MGYFLFHIGKGAKKRYYIPMESSTFTVSTDAFEGPLSLLLDLVQKRKFFISDIALAQVADEFIRTVESEKRSLAEDARFVSVAATLLLIKSKSLLPNFSLTAEEEESAEDLKERLAAFEALRASSRITEGLYGKRVLALRRVPKSNEIFFIPDEAIVPINMRFNLEMIRANLPQREMPERVSVKQTIRLEDVVASLSKRIRKHMLGSFKEFSCFGEAPKGDIVVHFIALLELVKQGFVEAHQSERGGDIELKHQEISVPNYS